MGNKPLITFDDVLKFGKHKGERVGDVFDENPQYLEWALDTVEGFDFSQEDEDNIREASSIAQEEYYREQRNNE